ncbi:hypothetical protein EPA93_06695 [Ktedonosporobacter rubrisoli]|uniref:Uncharacterized protein n=1 Tax=Ktedonosporobacter rubrisoli TaxID=2509675 RepID=A0A4P6JKL5_KTERU|nr:hypothetical protein [Ktedonosporobacter rubrisoli]QBD75709.1 hypothetical protein EPA93_06695 [Ktedonosporobacter rubrisoli]
MQKESDQTILASQQTSIAWSLMSSSCKRLPSIQFPAQQISGTEADAIVNNYLSNPAAYLPAQINYALTCNLHEEVRSSTSTSGLYALGYCTPKRYELAEGINSIPKRLEMMYANQMRYSTLVEVDLKKATEAHPIYQLKGTPSRVFPYGKRKTSIWNFTNQKMGYAI